LAGAAVAAEPVEEDRLKDEVEEDKPTAVGKGDP
jgi:hypothetical protein